jgi:hypothetical protein
MGLFQADEFFDHVESVHVGAGGHLEQAEEVVHPLVAYFFIASVFV